MNVQGKKQVEKLSGIVCRSQAIGVPPSTGLEMCGSLAWRKDFRYENDCSQSTRLLIMVGKPYVWKLPVQAKAGTGKMNFITDTVYFYHNLID